MAGRTGLHTKILKYVLGDWQASGVIKFLSGAAVGNFGNTPTGILRQPSWSNWDFTLAKRLPVPFTTIGTTFTFTGTNNSVNTNTRTGKYTATTPPRQLGLTVRLDFYPGPLYSPFV
jgi:hypothetical protein